MIESNNKVPQARKSANGREDARSVSTLELLPVALQSKIQGLQAVDAAQ